MRQALRILRDERGNMTVFVLTIFFFMALVMFTLLFNMSAIFVDKEQAANVAQQASLAATEVIYAETEKAIVAYDISIQRLTDPVLIKPQVTTAMTHLRAAHPDWSDSEVRYQAIDDVLRDNMPGSLDLVFYIQAGLLNAKAEIPGLVAGVITDNGATLGGSSVHMFNGEQRIEVKTSVSYESQSFGLKFIPSHKEQVYQTGQSRRIGFVEVMRWSDVSLSL